MSKGKDRKSRQRGTPEAVARRADRSGGAPPRPVVVNGWTLLFWADFRDRWDALLRAARQARERHPEHYVHTPIVKLFRTVRDLVFKEIPANPDHPQFRQGLTLGPAHTHWRRAKFHRRFRLFFRFHSASRTIIYAWMNDENTLRKAGAQSDPYIVFRRMLERGTPPTDWDALVRSARTLPIDVRNAGEDEP